MKAYLVPFRLDRCLALGDPKEGMKIEGPILLVPDRGAILYKTGIQGDAEAMGFATIGVDYFESQPFFLRQIACQIEGRSLIPDVYQDSKFDLSKDVVEVDIPKAEFERLAQNARISYKRLKKFKNLAMKLSSDLEQRLGRQKIYEKID